MKPPVFGNEMWLQESWEHLLQMGKGLGELLQGFKEMKQGAPVRRELGEHLVVAWSFVGFPSIPVTGGPVVSSQWLRGFPEALLRALSACIKTGLWLVSFEHQNCKRNFLASLCLGNGVVAGKGHVRQELGCLSVCLPACVFPGRTPGWLDLNTYSQDCHQPATLPGSQLQVWKATWETVWMQPCFWRER